MALYVTTQAMHHYLIDRTATPSCFERRLSRPPHKRGSRSPKENIVGIRFCIGFKFKVLVQDVVRRGRNEKEREGK